MVYFRHPGLYMFLWYQPNFQCKGKLTENAKPIFGYALQDCQIEVGLFFLIRNNLNVSAIKSFVFCGEINGTLQNTEVTPLGRTCQTDWTTSRQVSQSVNGTLKQITLRHCYLLAAKCSDPPDCANCFEIGYIMYNYGDFELDCRLLSFISHSL